MAHTVEMGPHGYKHRQNEDGSWDSICLGCYATVAQADHEPDLQDNESKHDCFFPLAGEQVH
jgi:hypothetical protein